jgi:hypothetical protein
LDSAVSELLAMKREESTRTGSALHFRDKYALEGVLCDCEVTERNEKNGDEDDVVVSSFDRCSESLSRIRSAPRPRG